MDKKEEAVKTETVKKQKKADYIYVQKFETDQAVFNIGDDCYQTNKDVIAYLLTKKIIKKK